MTKEQAVKLVEKNGTVNAAAREAGMARTTFRRLISQNENDRMAQTATRAKQPAEAKPVGKSLNDFKKVYDKDTIVPAKIRNGLALLGAGWEYEVQFARMAGVGLNDLGNYRDQFADNWHQIKADGRKVWSGSKSVINEIRKVVC